MPSSTRPDSAGDTEPWRTTILEPLLQGLAHALANRATALDGLAADAAESSSGRELAADLRAEVARLLVVHRDLRALVPDGGGAEPLDLRDIAREAASLAVYWPEGSPVPAAIEGDAPAVRVVRSAAVRVIVGMLVHAGLDGAAPALTLGGDDAAATLRVVGGNPGSGDAPDQPPWRAQVAADARAIGGTVEWGAGRAELRLPTLRALRAAARGHAT